MVEDILDMIGGRSTIKDATELFYDKILQDDGLRQFFEGVDMAHLRSRQTCIQGAPSITSASCCFYTLTSR